jgi:hypothetical protein
MNATEPGLLRREVTTLMFDQYGTVVDMQGGLTEMVTPFLAGKGWDGNPYSFVTWWRRTHFEGWRGRCATDGPSSRLQRQSRIDEVRVTLDRLSAFTACSRRTPP